MSLCDVLDDFEDLLNGQADLQRLTEGARDFAGNKAITWATIQQNIRVSVQPSISFSRWFEENQQMQSSVFDNVIFMERDSAFTPTHSDRITNYSINGVADGYTYEIRAVLDDGGEGHHWFLGANVVTT